MCKVLSFVMSKMNKWVQKMVGPKQIFSNVFDVEE